MSQIVEVKHGLVYSPEIALAGVMQKEWEVMGLWPDNKYSLVYDLGDDWRDKILFSRSKFGHGWDFFLTGYSYSQKSNVAEFASVVLGIRPRLAVLTITNEPEVRNFMIGKLGEEKTKRIDVYDLCGSRNTLKKLIGKNGFIEKWSRDRVSLA